VNERPLERLNYYNGQRLEAADLRLEQDYQMRTRRWLNRSLYTSGIADGLEVRQTGPNVVGVSPGLALDPDGREIILIDAVEVDAPSLPAAFLTIRYDERALAERRDRCCVQAAGGQGAAESFWSGPARVRAEPVIAWSRVEPHEGAAEIVLAHVAKSADCKSIKVVSMQQRRYVGAASAAKVRQYAIEGFRDIDPDNPGRIHFHIRGRQPTSVALYLRSEQFPTLFYTEIGKHTHANSVTNAAETGEARQIDAHSHGKGSLAADNFNPPLSVSAWVSSYDASDSPADWLALLAGVKGGVFWNPGPKDFDIGPGSKDHPPGAPPFMLRMITNVLALGGQVPVAESLAANVGMSVNGADHGHPISGSTSTVVAPPAPAVPLHKHPLSVGVTNAAYGVDQAAREGPPIGFVKGLRVVIGSAGGGTGRDYTQEIVQQLANAQPANWSAGLLGLGAGSGSDTLAVAGSGEIKLDFLPELDLAEGAYWIELQAPDKESDKDRRNGGRIHYNLYVE